MSITAVRRVNLRTQVLDQLREAILDGQLTVGEHLNETELASQFSVSRGTVREALRALEQAGLAESASHGRLVVRSFDATEVTELYEVRSFLECGAAVRLARSTDREAKADALAEALPVEDPGDLSEAVEQDLAFHRRLCELSGNGLLLAKWLELQDQMRIVIVAGAMNEGADIPVIVTRANHEPLVRTLRSGGEDEIIRAFADHMSRAGSFWVSRMGA